MNFYVLKQGNLKTIINYYLFYSLLFLKPFRDKQTTWKAANDFLACQSTGRRRRAHRLRPPTSGRPSQLLRHPWRNGRASECANRSLDWSTPIKITSISNRKFKIWDENKPFQGRFYVENLKHFQLWVDLRWGNCRNWKAIGVPDWNMRLVRYR